MTTIFKNFKHINAETQDANLKGLEAAINSQKWFIDIENKHPTIDSNIPLYNERIKNLNCLKEYLLNNK